MIITYDNCCTNPLEGYSDLEDFALACTRGARMEQMMGRLSGPVGKILCKKRELGFCLKENNYAFEFQEVAEKIDELIEEGDEPFAMIYSDFLLDGTFATYAVSKELMAPIVYFSKGRGPISGQNLEYPGFISFAPVLDRFGILW